jgi:transposase
VNISAQPLGLAAAELSLFRGRTCAFPTLIVIFMARNPINTADPDNRKLIIDIYEERGEDYIKSEFGVSRFAVNRWRTLKRETGSYAPHFNLKGRRKALSPRDVRTLEDALLSDPYLTNSELAAVVNYKVTPRAAGNYIKNSDHRFVSKLEQLDVEASFTQKHVEEGLAFQKKVQNIPLDKRVYVDETPIAAGIRRRIGRFPSGKAAWSPATGNTRGKLLSPRLI